MLDKSITLMFEMQSYIAPYIAEPRIPLSSHFWGHKIQLGICLNF